MLESYKKEQGILVRRVAFWVLTALIVWGGQTFYVWLINTFLFTRSQLVGGKGGEGYLIPILDQRFNIAFVISWTLTIAAVFGLWKLLNRPKSGEFLIETDSELRKVTWPNWKDAWNSSVIVLVFVAMLAVYLLASDKLIEFVMMLGLG